MTAAGVVGFKFSSTSNIEGESASIAVQGAVVTFAGLATEYVVILDADLDVPANAVLGQKTTYSIQLWTTSAVGNVKTFAVSVSNYTDVVEMGGLTIADASYTSQAFKFVDVGMTATGPSALIGAVAKTRAAILLAANSDGIVLFEQAAGNVSPATVQAEYGKINNTTYNLDEAVVPFYADSQGTVREDNAGFRRSALTINKDTVPGTYALVFEVDGLTRQVNLVINNASPKVFIMSGDFSATVPVSTPAPTNSDHTYSSSGVGTELIKYFDFVGALTDPAAMLVASVHLQSSGDKFAKPVNGVYTIDMPSAVVADKHALYANVAVADLPVGVYNYKIVKSYPDGRVETTQDTAAVTSVDGNGIAVFAAGSTLANNAKFLANWAINEQHEDFEKGTYTYEFTFGTVTRKYIINVVDRPLLKLSKISVGTTETILFDSKNSLKSVVYATAQDVKLDFTLQNLTSAQFISVVVDETVDTGTGAVFAYATAYAGEAKVKLTSNSIIIGSLIGSLDANDKYTITVKFWNNVDHSVSAGRYVSAGEDQVIVVGYIAPLA